MDGQQVTGLRTVKRVDRPTPTTRTQMSSEGKTNQTAKPITRIGLACQSCRTIAKKCVTKDGNEDCERCQSQNSACLRTRMKSFFLEWTAKDASMTHCQLSVPTYNNAHGSTDPDQVVRGPNSDAQVGNEKTHCYYCAKFISFTEILVHRLWRQGSPTTNRSRSSITFLTQTGTPSFIGKRPGAYLKVVDSLLGLKVAT